MEAPVQVFYVSVTGRASLIMICSSQQGASAPETGGKLRGCVIEVRAFIGHDEIQTLKPG